MSDLSRVPSLAVSGGKILVPSGELVNGTLLLAGGRVTGLLPAGLPVPEDFQILAANGCIVAPGFIDTHVHGGGGRNFMEATPAAVAAITDYLAAGGVTGCLATTTSASRAEIEAALKGLALVIADESPRPDRAAGAQVLGIHLEGPYLNPRYGGTQRLVALREPTVTEVNALHAAAGEKLRIVTMAPELPGADEAAAGLLERGVTVSLGHTAATYAQARSALGQGWQRGTHLFNAMAPLHHRAPGPVTALLEHPNAFLEIVADGYHVDLALVALVIRWAGPERVVLISDGADVAGQPDGTYQRWEGTDVNVAGGRVVTPEGTIAGSAIRLADAVRLLVQEADVPLAVALRMASETPARSLGLGGRKGTFALGADADAVVLRDDLSVAYTIVGGEVVYSTHCR